MTTSLRAKLKSLRKKTLSIVKSIFPFQAAAWKASSEPIRHMLDEPDSHAQDHLTAVWKHNIQAQLNTISITVRIHPSFYPAHPQNGASTPTFSD
jgi:hypothetical protein